MFTIFSSHEPPSPPSSAHASATGRACDTCRRLKVKCRNVKRIPSSSSQPAESCRQCLHAGLKCTYDEKPVKRGRRRKEHARQTAQPYSGRLLDLDFPSSQQPGLSLPETDRILADPELSSRSNNHVSAHADYERRGRDCEDLPFEFQTFDSDRVSANNNLGLVADGMLQDDELSRSDEIWNAIDEYFDTMYVVFPILSYTKLASRLIIEPAWRTIPEFCTLLLSIQMVNAAGQFRMTPGDRAHLSELITQVERSRLDYEFADPATLDSVVISLFLFTAYNVLEKHNRAFLYLDEALSLLETVDPVVEEERHRKLQIEQVLFNTEAATLAIYASKGRQRRARRPLKIVDGPPMGSQPVGAIDESDRVAMHLLRRLTEIHLAENAEAFERIDVESEADMATLFGAVFERHRYSRIQAADVIVTRQWQLSTKLVANLRQGLAISPRLQKSVEFLGLAAMSWICLLGEGELRIVGLGKLSSLAQNIYVLAGRGSCHYILGGLAGAVIKEDHEKIFAPQLAEVVMPLISTVPLPMSSRPHYEYQTPNTQPRTTMQVGPINVDVLESNRDIWKPLTQHDVGESNDCNSPDPINQFIDLS